MVLKRKFDSLFSLSFISSFISFSLLTFGLLPSANAIHGGEKVTGDPRVVALIHWKSDGLGEANCSGALISPRIVLTSAHCLSRNPLDGKIPSYNTALPKSGRLLESDSPLWVVAPGARVEVSDSLPRARAIAQFPSPLYRDGYCLKENPSQCFGPIYDFGVIVLDRPLSSKTFRIANAEELRALVRTNAEVVELGYGLTSHEEYLGTSKRDGMPRKIITKVRSDLLQVDRSRFVIYPEMMLLQTTYRSGQYTCGADSGAPAWFEKNGEWIYIGAAGSGMGPECSYAAEDPLWKDPFWSVNSGDHFDTAQAYPNEIAAAESFLNKLILQEQEELNQRVSKAEAEARAANEALVKAEAEARAANEALVKAEAEARAANEALVKAEAAAKAVVDKNASLSTELEKVKTELANLVSQVSSLTTSLKIIQADNAKLVKKLASICKSKPKPKGC